MAKETTEKKLIKLEVSTHSGDKDVIEVEEYDANSMAEELNDNEIHAIAIGDNVYSRIDIRNIRKKPDVTAEESERGVN